MSVGYLRLLTSLLIDEMTLFEDEDDDVKAYNRVDRRFRREVSCSTCFQTGLHIVYKRRDDGEHLGDYGK